MPFVRGDIVGGSYQGRSLAFSNSRCVNLYPEKSRTGGAKGPGVLYSCPGLVEHLRLSAEPIRAMAASQDTLYILAGTSLYAAKNAVAPTTDTTLQQTIPLGHASLVVNDGYTTSTGASRIQVGVADGGSWAVYTYDTKDSAKALSRVNVSGESGGFYQADMATWIHGFGVFIAKNSNKVYTTKSYDLATVSGLSFGVAGLHLGSLNAVAQLNQEIWLFSPLGLRSLV